MDGKIAKFESPALGNDVSSLRIGHPRFHPQYGTEEIERVENNAGAVESRVQGHCKCQPSGILEVVCLPRCASKNHDTASETLKTLAWVTTIDSSDI
jgi:hypothetical protein